MKRLKEWKVRNVVLAVLLAVVVPLSILSSIITFTLQRRDELSKIDTQLYTAATFAERTLPDNYHDNITDATSVPPEEFDAIVERYNELCLDLGLEYLWSLMEVDGVLVFTTATSPDKVVANRQHAKFFEPHTSPGQYEKALRTMEPQFQVNRDKWGTIRVVLIPHYDAHGRKYLFGASIKQSEVEAMTWLVLRNAATTALIFLVPGCIIGLFISRWITRPISRLAAFAGDIGEGHYGHRISISGAYEINLVAEQLNRMCRSVEGHIASMKQTLKVQENFCASVNSSPAIFTRSVLDENFTLDFISDNIGVTGFSAEQLMAGEVEWNEFIPQEDLDRSAETIRHALANGKDSYKLNVRLNWADGDVHWYESWGRFLKDDDGKATHVQGFLIDITEEKLIRERDEQHQKQLEAALTELRHFEQIVSDSPAIAFSLDAANHFKTLFISDNISQAGYRAEDFMDGTTQWDDLLPPEELEKLREAFTANLGQGNDSFTVQTKLITASGGLRERENYYQILKTADGTPYRLQGISIDITDRIRAQEREKSYLKKLENSLRQLSEFNQIVTSSPVFTFRRPIAEGFPTDHISENISVTGYSADDFLRGNVKWEDLIPKADYELLETNALQSVEKGIDSYEVEFRMVWKNGETHWYVSWNNILRDQEGNPTHVQGLVSDITDLKKGHERDIQYQRRLKALAEDLVQAEDRERRQLAIALHDDIGQMLAGLNMKLSVLKETRDRDRIDALVPQVDELLSRIMQTCKTLTWEISPTSLYETDIGAGLERMAGDLETLFGLEVGVFTAGARIEAERKLSALIFRCAKELLVNIAKHSGTTTAEIGISQYGNKIHLVVADEGKGFQPEESGNGAEGFGLFSIRERIEQINGSMHVESVPGKGTRVMIIFPQSIDGGETPNIAAAD